MQFSLTWNWNHSRRSKARSRIHRAEQFIAHSRYQLSTLVSVMFRYLAGGNRLSISILEWLWPQQVFGKSPWFANSVKFAEITGICRFASGASERHVQQLPPHLQLWRSRCRGRQGVARRVSKRFRTNCVFFPPLARIPCTKSLSPLKVFCSGFGL